MTRNQRLSAVRGWFHDQKCQSETCNGDNDHARRMHGTARRFVDATTDQGRITVLHEAFCPAAIRGLDCANTEAHEAIAAEKILPVIEAEVS